MLTTGFLGLAISLVIALPFTCRSLCRAAEKQEIDSAYSASDLYAIKFNPDLNLDHLGYVAPLNMSVNPGILEVYNNRPPQNPYHLSLILIKPTLVTSAAYDSSVKVVPEPSTLCILGAGLVMIIRLRKFKRPLY